MNVVYLYRQSEWAKELKYSIRSVEKYVNPDRILVIGDSTDLAVENVEISRKANKYEDVCISLHQALYHLDRDVWLLMHDDMFLLEDYAIIKRHDGKLSKHAKRTAKDRRQCFEKVLDFYPWADNYSLHYPMPFRKDTLEACFTNHRIPFSYMNALGNRDTSFLDSQTKDCKFKAGTVNKKALQGMPCFSTYGEDDTFEKLLRTLYPKPSKYEK